MTLSAVLTSDGEPVPGKTISFLAPNGLLIKGPVCTAQTNASGVASCGSVLPGVVASLLSGYDASFAGDTSFAPASAHGTIAVVRLKLL